MSHRNHWVAALLMTAVWPLAANGGDGVIVHQLNDPDVLSWPGLDGLSALDGDLYFSVRQPEPGDEDIARNWWRYDGSAFAMIGRIDPSRRDSGAPSPVLFRGALYYQSYGSFGGPNRLMRFDGTAATVAINDDYLPHLVYTPPLAVASSPPATTTEPPPVDGAELILTRTSGCCINGGDIWRYSGTTPNEIGDAITTANPFFGGEFIVHAGNVYSFAYLRLPGDSQPQRALLRYDGTDVQQLATVHSVAGPGPNNMFAHGNDIFLAACSSSGDCGLHRFDVANPSGGIQPLEFPVVVAPIQDAEANGDESLIATAHEIKSPREFFEYDDQVYFFGSEIEGYLPDSVDYLWRINGETVERVAQVRPFGYDGSPGQQRYEPTVFDGDVYFLSGEDYYATTLWRFDGESVERVTDRTFYYYGDYQFQLTVVGDKMFFTGREIGDDAHSLYAVETVPEPSAALLALAACVSGSVCRYRRLKVGSASS